MAVKRAVRWQPDAKMNVQQTLIGGLDTSTNPAGGTVTMVAQLVAYDDTVVTGGNYSAGDPATEKNLAILYQEPVSMDLASFNGLTAANAKAQWDAALAAFGTRMQTNAADALIQKAVLSARRSAPVVIA